MPRFVKWSKTARDQEFWSFQWLSPTSFFIKTGMLRDNSKLRGQRHDHATAEEAQAAGDAALAKQAKRKGWLAIAVPEVPTVVGAKQRYEDERGVQWEIEVTDETTLATTEFRDAKPAGRTVWASASTIERDDNAELLIARAIASGFTRIDGGRTREKSRFIYTGYFE